MKANNNDGIDVEKPSFLADAMLGSIARKLRIFGFDTLYIPHIQDDEILRVASTEGRIILTCDRELFKRAVKMELKGTLLGGLNEYDDLVHLLSKNCIGSIKFDSACTRCSACNGVLQPRAPQEVVNDVPSNVMQRQARFYKCASCGKVYWEGSHLDRMQALAERINSGLRAGINLL